MKYKVSEAPRAGFDATSVFCVIKAGYLLCCLTWIMTTNLDAVGDFFLSRRECEMLTLLYSWR